MKNYILSVDGGNTKTDYLLTDTKGEFISISRYGTCSHEQFTNSYIGMYEAMKSHLDDFFYKNKINVSNIKHSTFGLAGCDMPSQQQKLCEKIKELGFSDFDVSNDALLGLFAINSKGIGVCSVCGTGTVTVGIDDSTILQVGGIGSMSGDFAGGSFLYREVVSKVYEYYFKNGEKTVLTKYLENILDYNEKSQLHELINSNKIFDNQIKIIQSLDKAVIEKDFVATNIVLKMAKSLGNTSIGCINNLDFSQSVDIVLIGSLWTKLKNKIFLDTYKTTVSNNIDKRCNFIILDTPPVVGGIFNSMKKINVECNDDYKNRLKNFLTIEQYENIIGINKT